MTKPSEQTAKRYAITKRRGGLEYYARQLEESGLARRTSYHEIPPRVESALNPKGRDALPVLEALRAYGARWLLPLRR